MTPLYLADFTTECRICGTSPCVVVSDHSVPDTELCGICFFHSRFMIDPSLWNDPLETSE